MVFKHGIYEGSCTCSYLDEKSIRGICLGEALQMDLEGVRQARSSFARLIFEFWYLDAAT